MPNWCLNKLTIEHEEKSKIEEFLQAYNEGKTCEHYLPTPKDENGELIEGNDRTMPDWYEYRLNNWGTKWDFGIDKSPFAGASKPDVSEDGKSVKVEFDSAWSPPTAFYQHLITLGYDVYATYWEPGMAFCGIWDNGCENYIDYGSDTTKIPKELWDDYDMVEFM